MGHAIVECSTRWDRATPSVSAATFTGNRPVAATATAKRAFPPGGQRFLEHLDFHGLAVALAYLRPADLWRNNVTLPSVVLRRCRRGWRHGDSCRQACGCTGQLRGEFGSAHTL